MKYEAPEWSVMGEVMDTTRGWLGLTFDMTGGFNII